MDTDGYPMPDGGVEFCSTSSALVDAVVELTQSLGGVGRGRRWAAATYDHKGEKLQGRPAERVNLKLPRPYNLFRLERKAVLYKVPTKYGPNRSIVSIETTGRVEKAVCIKVANPDGLYLTRSYIVTHNTVCVIAAVERLIDSGDIGGGLIIVPSSLKYQWARQIDLFTGGQANVVVVDGDKKRRHSQYVDVKAGRVEYTVMNYEQVVNDWSIVKHLPRDFICIDEAQAIKGMGSARTIHIKKLPANYRWALTGQPVENRADEVFSIMQWVDQTILGPPSVFESTFIMRDGWGKVKRYKNLPVLHKALSRAMVRRTWEDPDVKDQMPQVTEESIFVDFDPAGARLYRLITEELLDSLAAAPMPGSFDLESHYSGDDNYSGESGAIMSQYTCLRMACDHPELLRISAAAKAGEKVATGGGRKTGSLYAYELRERGLIPAPNKNNTSPKLEATIDLLQEILSANPRNKVVLFSFFKDSLDIIAQHASKFVNHALFTGDLSAKKRDTEKQRFLDDPKCRLLLSSDAGGTGVDLPNANYLISYDLPWSAGAWNQRNARIIRLSSEFDKITLISMLMAGSIEERQYDALAQKQRVAKAITDGTGANAKGELALDLDSLTDFLKASII